MVKFDDDPHTPPSQLAVPAGVEEPFSVTELLKQVMVCVKPASATDVARSLLTVDTAVLVQPLAAVVVKV